ncbi:MAG: peptidoglycan editing factor PgeF [Alphaproteobacteria bacterium]
MIEARALLRHPEIRHGFFTRRGGTSTGEFSSLNCGASGGDTQTNVADNRTRVATALGVYPGQLVTARQVHSATAIVVDAPFDEPPRGDALVTGKRDIALGILTADCAPVLFVDPQAQIIGAAHAGWRGALDGILEATIATMVSLGAQATAITATIGPCIQQSAYEVGAEFRARFVETDPGNEIYFKPSQSPGHHMFDLPEYCARRLHRFGVGAVARVDCCTYADTQRFFSYRRATHSHAKHYGNQISAITLGPGAEMNTSPKTR